MKKGFLTPSKAPSPLSPATAQRTRRAAAPAAHGLAAHGGLAALASLDETSEALRERGYATLRLSADEAEVLAEAERAAGAALGEAGKSLLSVRTVVRPSGAKRVLTVGRSPLHTAESLLRGAADAALDGVSALLDLPAGRLRALAGDHSETTLSAMQYEAEGGACEAHEDRGLLTLVAGREALRTLEVYDRVTRSWVAPRPPPAAPPSPSSPSSSSPPSSSGEDAWVLLFAGATLFRATAGLVPQSADAETIGATLHRVVAPASAAAGGAAAAAAAERFGGRLSLVLRVRATPSAAFDCAALRGRPGAVPRFVSARESVAEHLASKNYVSVNESTTGVPPPPSSGSAPPPLDDPRFGALVERCYDAAAERCARAGAVSAAQLDGLTDVVARFSDPPSRARCLLGQLQGLEMLLVHEEGIRAKAAPGEGRATCGDAAAGALSDRRELAAALADAPELSASCAMLRELLRRPQGEEPAADEAADVVSQPSEASEYEEAEEDDDDGKEEEQESAPLAPLQLMRVTVPPNVHAGEQMVVLTPTGQQYMVVIPQGAGPNSHFQIAVPRPPTPEEADEVDSEDEEDDDDEERFSSEMPRRERERELAARLAEARARQADAREREERAAREREAEAARRRRVIRERIDATRAILTEQLEPDAADLVVRNAAAQQLQAAARGYAVRKRGWPWSRIRLTVVDQEGIEIFFTLKRRTRLGKLMSAYCQRQGLATQGVRFLFDGERLNAYHTPVEMDMEDGDIIDVMREQLGD